MRELSWGEMMPPMEADFPQLKTWSGPVSLALAVEVKVPDPGMAAAAARVLTPLLHGAVTDSRTADLVDLRCGSVTPKMPPEGTATFSMYVTVTLDVDEWRAQIDADASGEDAARHLCGLLANTLKGKPERDTGALITHSSVRLIIG